MNACNNNHNNFINFVPFIDLHDTKKFEKNLESTAGTGYPK